VLKRLKKKKRAKNLCFFCDEKYISGHKCRAQVYQLEIMGEEEGEMEEEEEELQDAAAQGEVHTEDGVPHISLHALNGTIAYQTMRINGRAGRATLHILIDSGSTHNFLDISVAKRLHCKARQIPPL